MTVVKLFQIGDLQQEPVAVFDDGEYTVGRGPFLTDKRISRQHGSLKVSKDTVTLTAVHQNPCYYKTENGNIKMLLKGESVTLQDKDEFSFLKENSWLKVAISKDTITENIAKPIGDDTSCKVLLKGESVTVQDKDEFSLLKENSWLKVEISNDAITENIAKPVGDETSCTMLLKGENVTLQDKDKFSFLKENSWLKVAISNDTITENIAKPVDNETSCTMSLKGESVTLQDKDKFSFLKENSWLKVAISNDTITGNIEEPIGDETSCKKRNCSFDSPQTSQKIARIEESAGTNTNEINTAIPSQIVENSSTMAQIKDEPLDTVCTIKEELVIEKQEEQTTLDVIVAQIKEEEVKDDVAETASCASTCVTQEINQDHPEQSAAVGDGGGDKGQPKRNWRDRCWYGKKCYRKNTEHKATFSHPGDSDYATDPEDDRPSCSYGAACYRRNSVHRHDYKHPSNGGKQPNTKKKPKKRTENSTVDEAGNEEDDEYDLEDPFINDDSGDDFQPDEDDDDTDADWEESQELDYEEEDTKQLLKEAKRITRNKEKK